jgi:fructose-1,6-bisphosphatase/inositol monophosphatase family enzyme
MLEKCVHTNRVGMGFYSHFSRHFFSHFLCFTYTVDSFSKRLPVGKSRRIKDLNMPNQGTSHTAATLAAAVLSVTLLHQLFCKRKKNPVPPKYQIPPELLHVEYSEELQLAVKLAMQAGENMIPHLESKGTDQGCETNLGINIKQNKADFATIIDLQNEELVINGLKERFPDHEIIGEEMTGTGAIPPLTDKPTFIIDPIDGTTNFASGSPLTCVSIGLCVKGRPVMGVVFSPVTRELFLAHKGCGAFRNAKKISSTSGKCDKSLSNAVVCFEFGYTVSEDGVNNMVDAARRILLHGCRTTRTYGAGVLDLCMVAYGAIDVCYTGIAGEGWKPWDYCAATCIAEEAGCTIQSLKDHIDGQPFDIYSKSMICGVNRTIVDECRNVVLGLKN